MAEALDPPFDLADANFNSIPGWTWLGCYGGHYLQADLLAGFEHGFFTRQWHGRGPDELAGYVSAGVSVHQPRQIHSALVLPASAAAGEPWPAADGLVSDAGGQSLWVCGADCTPVLLADPRRGAVAACHAGWRGVAGRILIAAIEQLEAMGSIRSDLLIALGPAVSGDNYQVQRPVSLQLAMGLGLNQTAKGPVGQERALAELQSCGALLDDPQPGHDRLDIRAAARRQLELAGIPSSQIALCPLCTMAEPLLFHSWRRDQVKAVQWSGIVSQA
jgi:YfiH family protein